MRALVGLGLALAACFSPSAQVGAPCSSTGQCPAGQHCNQQVDPSVCAAADARPADAPPDAPPSCATSADCAAVAPVCDITTHTCRACAADAECGETAICIEHAGQCVGDSNVLFVATAGVNQGACTRAAPCATIDFAVGLVANTRRPSRSRFNTVASNLSSLSASAVACPTTLALESSIFSGDPSAVMPQLSPACAPTYSLFSGTAPAGTGNLSGDPAYAGAGDFHIGPSSAARDAADPAATTSRDIDNEVRPQGGGRDVGADEVP